MCGIAGAIGRITPALAETVRRMNECIAHRGPDAEGLWVSPGSPEQPGAALAQRRLAIIDLSEGGRQPMADPDNGNMLVFNGEIYNFQEVKAELAGIGHRFRSKSDTEVILKAYLQWGAACVERLRGMFTIVLWDAAKREVLIARDRVGIKPLYWARVMADGGPAVLFASEVRAILDTGLVSRKISHTGLSSFLWNGFVIGPGSFVEGIELLPPGTIAVVRPEAPEVRPRTFWKIPAPKRQVSDPSRVGHALAEAVKQHLISDVPLGVFLSGGVDSSAIAALAVKAASGTVQTYNVSFDEAEFDEAPYARRVAESLGTEHHELRLTQGMFAEQLPAALGSIDQPTFDAINTYFVSRIVRETGTKVALAGTGGDELFGGYKSFAELPRLRRASRACAAAPAGLVRTAAHAAARVKVGGRGSGGMPPQTRWGKLADALGTRGRMLDLYQVAYGLFTRDFLEQLTLNAELEATRYGVPPQRAGELDQLIAGRPDLSAISALELSNFLGERLLRDTDAASMAVALEVRVPFLDHVLIEEVAALEESVRFGAIGSKQLLRDLALKDMDPAIFDRPKSGFVLPLEVWCRHGLSGMVEDTLRDEGLCRSVGLKPAAVSRLWDGFKAGAPGLYWSRVWALFIVLWWSREYRIAR